jgi:NAD(P)-dependent dehydrogenase (short-subunit alcohol dehydrogenase family)
MTTKLKNKVVLLTRGSTSIGRECAVAYARERAIVAVLHRDLDDANVTAELEHTWILSGGDVIANAATFLHSV